MGGRKIETEEQYMNSLTWLVEKAELLEHPLFDEVKKAELMKKYDFVAANVRAYNRILYGLDSETTQEKSSLPQDEKTVDLSDWLNDD